jgi:hypothetical protein
MRTSEGGSYKSEGNPKAQLGLAVPQVPGDPGVLRWGLRRKSGG